MQRAAIFASCRPVALETKGTVREARGLHDAADQHLVAIAEGIDIDFTGVVEEAVEEYR